jgi:hypothetical protein
VSFGGKWMELEIVMLSKITKTQKDKYCVFSLICRIEGENDLKIEEGLLGKRRGLDGGGERGGRRDQDRVGG